tara:strand:- start:1729 stop:2085 length:357 start_codon:yes stop_codon:yes gene_type:complete
MTIPEVNKPAKNRYEIYEISDKKVTIINNESRIKGKVKEVYRNPSDRSIVVSIGSKKLSFHEPNNIVREGNRIMLVYGDEFQSDREMFEQIELNFGMDINQFLSEIPDCKIITFEIDE